MKVKSLSLIVFFALLIVFYQFFIKDKDVSINYSTGNSLLQEEQTALEAKEPGRKATSPANLTADNPSAKADAKSSADPLAYLDDFRGLDPQEQIISLIKAAQSGELEYTNTLLALVENGVVDPNASFRPDVGHYTPLFAALVLDHDLTVEQVQKFLALGTNISNPEHWPALMGRIAKHKNFEVGRIFIENGDYSREQLEQLAVRAFGQLNTDLYTHLSSLNEGFIENNIDQLSEYSTHNIQTAFGAYNKQRKVLVPGDNLTSAYYGPGSPEYRLHYIEKFYQVQSNINFLLASNALSVDKRQELQKSLAEVENRIAEILNDVD